jgi:hypothetical protein
MSVMVEDALDVSHRFSFTFNDSLLGNSQSKTLDSGLFDPGKKNSLRFALA